MWLDFVQLSSKKFVDRDYPCFVLDLGSNSPEAPCSRLYSLLLDASEGWCESGALWNCVCLDHGRKPQHGFPWQNFQGFLTKQCVSCTHQLWDSQTNSKVESAAGASLQQVRCPAQIFYAFLGCHKPQVKSSGCFHLGFGRAFLWEKLSLKVRKPRGLALLQFCAFVEAGSTGDFWTDFGPFCAENSSIPLRHCFAPSLEAYLSISWQIGEGVCEGLLGENSSFPIFSQVIFLQKEMH